MPSRSCVIVQSGAFGDLITCCPIAAYYANSGFQVFWPSRGRHLDLIKRLPYVTPVQLDDVERDPDWLKSDAIQTLELDITRNADIILNLADRGPHPTEQGPGENFEITKYRLAGIPLFFKHTLSWGRNFEKEEALKKLVCPDGPYNFAHLTNSYKDRAEMPIESEIPLVEGREIEGYDIFDWIQVIQGAENVFAVESSFFHLIDGTVLSLKNKPFILKKAVVDSGTRHCVANFWDHRFIGQTRLTG